MNDELSFDLLDVLLIALMMLALGAYGAAELLQEKRLTPAASSTWCKCAWPSTNGGSL